MANLFAAIPDEIFNLLLWIGHVLAVAGGIFVGLGLAGRRAGFSPRCRKCGFDLRSAGSDAKLCPECGASLTGRRSIAYGVRARRWGLVSVGVFLLALMFVSSYYRIPPAIIQWRSNLIVEAFPLDKMVELAAKGDAFGTRELLANLNGTARRMSPRASSMPGQDALIAILDYMDRDPTSRAVFLPMIMRRGPAMGAFMWMQNSSLTLRLAHILADVAHNDPTLFDSLATASLNDVFRNNNNPAAIRELLAEPALLGRLYKGNTSPHQRVKDPDGGVRVRVAPSFGGEEELWMQQYPLGITITEAKWHLSDAETTSAATAAADAADAPASAWHDVEHVHRTGLAAASDMTLGATPDSGFITVRVRGLVIQGPEAELLRNTSYETDLRKETRPTVPTAQGAPPPPEPIPFEWTRVIELKRRADLVLKPVSPAVNAAWLDMTLGRASLVTMEGSAKDEYQVMSELGNSINNASLQFKWTLEQDGKSWGSAERTVNDREMTFITAPGFDPSKPFTIRTKPDLEALREKATSDTEYLDLNALLIFDSVNRTPREVQGITGPARGLPAGTGGSPR